MAGGTLGSYWRTVPTQHGHRYWVMHWRAQIAISLMHKNQTTVEELCQTDSPTHTPFMLTFSGDDVCGVSVRIRGFDHNVIQIWNMDSEQHSKSSVSLYPVSLFVCLNCVSVTHQVIQRVKELIPSIEINEFYQCMCPLLPSLSILLSFPAVIT